MLLDEFKDYPGVQNYHMAYKANEAGDQVIFLYKFVKGTCPKSFGLNVARMAGIPAAVLEIARAKSDSFGTTMDELTKRIKE